MWHNWAFAAVVVAFLLAELRFGLLRKGFDSIVQPKDQNSTNGVFRLFVAGLFVLVAVLGLALYLDAWKSGDQLSLGTFGDFVGGVVNPVLTFLTFMGLLITILLQQRGLAEAHQGAKEATFFEMLNLHNAIVNAMDVHRSGRETLHGRDCFRFFANEIEEGYKKSRKRSELDRALDGHEALWGKFSGDLAHYYRYLYNLIRYIDENLQHDKMKYIKVLRALISNDELLVLFYNGLTSRAENFKVYIERFAIFDNLPPNAEFKPAHRAFYGPGAFDEKLATK
ncbi:putative phage abortive infection protein [Mesorhizobium sp. BR1-1-9]|uniref:putative phage abortive infection protein n=1 Tax=unclassified Mesorhizobium TaxID=325217 RepID=UPI001CD077BA|nr:MULTISPECIES: putative phage abortive infection protein [unclassified Mesorhizobium]MBZ9872947.1 putative phage abortive infection protein [Mesorhizobium sp. BR1-1-9]MBZ9944098.1 putative phage abortive infection protein [Mesorhizobium sp. BR1-1-13]